MPEPWEFVVIVALAYSFAVMLSYIQWVSDDSNFDPEFKPWTGLFGSEVFPRVRPKNANRARTCAPTGRSR